MVKLTLRPLWRRERIQLPTEQESGLAQEPIWAFGEKVLHLRGFETGNVTDSVVAVSRYTDYAFPGHIIRPTFAQLTG